MKDLKKIISDAKEAAFDMHFSKAKDWKSKKKGRVLVGYLPVYFPREIIHAMNGLGVGIMGIGDQIEVIRGDAYYQSYMCRMPRGIMELALGNYLEGFDGFMFPSICDVIRNLSGVFKIHKPNSFVKYFDFPQNFNPQIGGNFYKKEILSVIEGIQAINGETLTPEKLNESIRLYNINRKLTDTIYNIRSEKPWLLSAEEWYYLQRAGLVIPVEEHNALLEEVISLLPSVKGNPQDNIRVVVTGAFCEQPPPGLIKTIEMAGCYIVYDDFIQGSSWIQGDIACETEDPLDALVRAYLYQSTFSSSFYDVDDPKGKRLITQMKKYKADGVVFAAPGFCDPALLDRTEMQKEMDRNNLRYVTFQYSENTGQFKVIKEQVGAFSDSIKLWDQPILETADYGK